MTSPRAKPRGTLKRFRDNGKCHKGEQSRRLAPCRSTKRATPIRNWQKRPASASRLFFPITDRAVDYTKRDEAERLTLRLLRLHFLRTLLRNFLVRSFLVRSFPGAVFRR